MVANLVPKPEFEIDTPEEGWSYEKKDTGVEFKMDGTPDVKVLVTFNRVPANLDLHKGGLDFFINEIQKQIPESEFRNKDNMVINGLPAIEFEFIHDQKGKKVHKLQVFVKNEGLLYSITCIAPEKQFYVLKETFESITTSFRKPNPE